MEKLESVLRFDKYIVDEVVFKTNPEFNPTDDKLKINFSIKKDVKHKDNGQMVVSLQVNIFEKANEKNYPFEMMVQLRGFFTMSDPTINLDSNAIAILYPYIRSIVSVYTSSINVPPLILPVINVNALIEQLENEKSE